MKSVPLHLSIGNALTSRLWPFVLVSLCLHAALLLTWRPAPSVLAGGEPVLSVGLHFVEPVADRRPERKEAARSAEKSRTALTASEKSDVGSAPLVDKTAQRTPDTRRNKDESMSERAANAADRAQMEERRASGDGAADDAGHARLARARVRDLLLADLARYFEYPWLARHRGWQGMVWLSVTVEPNGTLERVRIIQSSGYEVLDRSAVETMQRVGQLADARRWLKGRALELPLPIVYRLTD